MRSDPRAAVGLGSGARLSTALAVALACVVLLTLLGHKPLTNWDEAIYAEVSREMLSSGWLVPHWNGQVWLEKPPLMLWITAAFFKLFGVTEFWARAGSALSGVAIVALLHGWLHRRGGLLAGWLCTLILLSTFGFLHICRAGEMDVLLSLGCCLALCGLTDVSEHKLAGWYLFWVGFAVAAMTKGGASIVLPTTAMALALSERWSGRSFGKQFRLGLLLFLALVLPWHLLMLHRYPQQFLREYLGYHLLARAMQPLEDHVTHGWFYLWVLFVSAMPWVLLYPVALYRGLRSRELRPWAVFPLVVLILFSLVQTRLPHYIAPAYPPMALLTALFLADLLKKLSSVPKPSRAWAMYGAILIALSAAGIALTTAPRGRLHRARGGSGETVSEDKEPVRLVREVLHGSPPAPAPLLVWQDHLSSIATSVFYSGHRVQQVQLSAPDAAGMRDKYNNDPMSLDQAVREGAYLLLIEKKHIQHIPPAFHFQELESGQGMAIGWIERR